MSKRYAKIEECSEYSGLSVRTLHRMVADGRLTGYRPIAGRLLIDLHELDAFVRAAAGGKCARGRYREAKQPVVAG